MPFTQKRKSLLPNFTVTVSLCIALFLMGLCGLLTILGGNVSESVKQNIEIQAYLEQNLLPGEADSIVTIVSKKNYVAEKQGIRQVQYVTKEEAAKEFIQDSGEDFTKFLKENPLHDRISIKVQGAYFSEKGFSEIKADLEKITGVFEVEYVQNFADEVNKNLGRVYLIMASFVVLLLVVIVVLINNTIRLSLYSQRFTIRSMQLVGATNNFIRKPFLAQGALQGLVSGLVAILLLWLLIQAAKWFIPEISLVIDDYPKLLILAGIILVIGVLIGFLSTLQAVQRYLKMSIEELY